MSEKINANARYDLALVYFCGCGVKKDSDKGRKLLKIAAEEGCAEAQKLSDAIDGISDSDLALEIIKHTGRDPEGGDTLPEATIEDIASYKDTLYKAANGDAVEACKLAEMYKNGKNPVVKNVWVSQNWLRRACHDEHCENALALGISLYENGSEEAASLFEKLIDAGVNEAKYYLGECYYSGLGVEKNTGKAVEFLQEASDMGNPDAQATLGGCFLLGEGVEKNAKKGFELLRKAESSGNLRAKIELSRISSQLEEASDDLLEMTIQNANEGDADSQLELAGKYAAGDDVGKDLAKAVLWYRKAFENEDASVEIRGEAGLKLAEFYIDGKGVEKNGEEALNILRAAESLSKNSAVQCALGALYLGLSGDSIITKDVDKGFEYLKKAAEQSEPMAEFGLAICYLQEWGVEKDVNAVRRWAARSAVHGNVEAREFYKEKIDENIPDEFMDRDASEEEIAEYETLKEKALAGDEDAQYDLAENYYYGRNGAKENEQEAVYWYRKAAMQDNPDAMYSLGICYYNGQGVSEDDARAFFWFEKGALKENKEAEYMTAVCHLNGRGTKENKKMAVFWFERSAKQGYSKAMRQMGDSHRLGRGTLEKNDEKALEWYRKAAEKDDAIAQYWIAEFYEDGRGGLETNQEESFSWRLKSAENGDVDSMNAVGWAYQKGIGTEIDEEKAVAWYGKAIEEDSAKAMNNLAKCYEDAIGVERDIGKAFELFSQSAEKGFSRGCYHLGRFYEEGLGVEADIEKAKHFYEKAADKGDKDAKRALERIG